MTDAQNHDFNYHLGILRHLICTASLHDHYRYKNSKRNLFSAVIVQLVHDLEAIQETHARTRQWVRGFMFKHTQIPRELVEEIESCWYTEDTRPTAKKIKDINDSAWSANVYRMNDCDTNECDFML